MKMINYNYGLKDSLPNLIEQLSHFQKQLLFFDYFTINLPGFTNNHAEYIFLKMMIVNLRN